MSDLSTAGPWSAAPWTGGLLLTLCEISLLLAVACVLDRLLQLRLHPLVRGVVWHVVLACLLVPPTVVRWLLGSADLGLPASYQGWVVSLPIPLPLAASAEPLMAPWSLSALGVWPVGGWPLGVWALVVWSLGVLALASSWLVRTRLALRRLHRAPVDAEARHLVATLAREAGVACAPRVAIDPATSSPYCMGLLAPRLVLPTSWRQWPEAVLEHAIRHELTHLRRRDLWLEALWMLATALYWFHPLVHWARARSHDVREMCCDAEVAARVGPQYRSSMLRLAVAVADGAPPFWGAPVRHGWGPIVSRIKVLDRWPRSVGARWRWMRVLVVVGVVAVVLPGHVRFDSGPSRVAFDQELLDAQTRQERGLGSLHLRYALRQAMTQ